MQQVCGWHFSTEDLAGMRLGPFYRRCSGMSLAPLYRGVEGMSLATVYRGGSRYEVGTYV